MTTSPAPTLAAAIALAAWRGIAPLQHARWLGPLLAAAPLRDRGKARHHLPCLHESLKAIPRQRRVESPSAPALAIQLEAITLAGLIKEMASCGGGDEDSEAEGYFTAGMIRRPADRLRRD